MKSIKDINLKNKNILLRTDFNVTLNPEGKIIDDIRLRASLPTIRYLIKSGAKRIVIISHLGRPIIQPKATVEKIIAGNKSLVLAPVAKELAKLLKLTIYNGQPTTKLGNLNLPFYKLTDQIYLSENIRFLPEEEENNKVLSARLAKLGDLFVNDAFAVSHRTHASTVGVAKILPSYPGFLMEKEINNLTKLLAKPPKPFVLVLGGAKVGEKIKTLANLIKKINFVILGGVMANTFLASREIDVKNSLVDVKSLELADEIYSQAAGKFYLPQDLVWQGSRIVDIGKQTQNQYEKIIAKAKTIFMNGTMGLTSLGSYKYAVGTHAIIKAVAESEAIEKIICGGDTIAEVDRLNLIKKMSFISTGGGATLKFLAGEKLPGIEVLG